MDFEEKKRRERIRVIIAELGMVISVIALVAVSAMATMGFMISDKGGIEQLGLMQLHSLPTGATVSIDGNTVFARTNLSRTLSAGEHYLELSRDNYDTWSKTIKVYSGALLRVYYPRLFLQNRSTENVTALTSTETDLEFYVTSPNRNYAIYAEKSASDWQLLDLRGDEVKTTILDLSAILPGMIEQKSAPTGRTTASIIEQYNYQFEGKIEEIRWSSNEENLLVKVSYDGKTEWYLLRLKDLGKSINLTKAFGLGDVRIAAIDSAASQLYVLEKNQLRRINASDGTMSRILLENVIDFANYGSSVIYLAKNPSTNERSIGVYRENDKAGTIICTVPESTTKVQIALSRYYDEDYIAYLLDDQVNILYGKLPTYDENGADLSRLKQLVEDTRLSTVPDSFSVSPDGEYLLARKGTQIMTIDLDMGDLYEYEAGSSNYAWLDASMLYSVSTDEIWVWDFDGTNRRNLATSSTPSLANTTIRTNTPLTITTNNRWLYYLTQDNKSIYLTRERIRE